jgi:hypothetical protein
MPGQQPDQDNFPPMQDKKYPAGKVWERLYVCVDNSGLVLFRICFGFLLLYHSIASLLNGSVYRNFIEPPFTFNFIGFDFLQPLPGNGMYWYVGLMAVLALGIMLGAWYRICAAAFALMWTLLYLMQKSDYNNHHYLVLILCWFMVLVPAHGFCSVDARRGRITLTNTCPAWCTWIFMAQVAIVFFFAAVSKLDADWLSGKFLTIRFSRLSMHRVYGILYGQPWFPVVIAYAGILFDLLIVPLLLWKKTRKIAFTGYCIFHLFNSFTFGIGIFPYLSISLAVFYFDPLVIRKTFFRTATNSILYPKITPPSVSLRKTIVLLLGLYFMLQLYLPVRSWFYPGHVFWTEEGYRMGWKMMMRTKSGTVHFKVKDPSSGKSWTIEPSRIFSKAHMMWLAGSPDIIWQYAQRLKKDFARKGYPEVQVFAIGQVSINRQIPKPLVDSTVNLAAVRWQPFCHASWITEYQHAP